MSMEHHATGNLDSSDSAAVDTKDWKQISIKAQSLTEFEWEIVCDERWDDPNQAAYKCHRITRKAKALSGYLYSVATHIAPTAKLLSPSVSESLIFVPTGSEAA